MTRSIGIGVLLALLCAWALAPAAIQSRTPRQLGPAARETATNTATPTRTSPPTPTPTRSTAAHLALVVRGAPTPTPTPPPPSFVACDVVPDGVLPEYPIVIVSVDKIAETVTLWNVSAFPVNLTGWRLCSLRGGQEHPIGGIIQPNDFLTFANPGGPIWNNTERDQGLLYTPDGRLVSYWPDV